MKSGTRGLHIGTYAVVVIAATCGVQADCGICEGTSEKLQYDWGSIKIPRASPREPIRDTVSAELADRYLTNGALAWSRGKGCVSCHTNGSYLAVRSALARKLGPPSTEIRKFFVAQLDKLAKRDPDQIVDPATIAYIALGLAQWDKYLSRTPSPEMDRAMLMMFTTQSPDGSWRNSDCWPPFESSDYQTTTIAAMATASAPGWLANLPDGPVKHQVEKMKEYLRNTEPPHDYGRLLLLWTSTYFDDLLDDRAKEALIEMAWSHQRSDGGWSIRSFAEPDQWGGGNRAAKLRAEPEFGDPPSDGHQTGLAVLVLREAGVDKEDVRIQRAVAWLKSNQRETGRWWTRSLNKDTYHFITYSGTGYALLALANCDAL